MTGQSVKLEKHIKTIKKRSPGFWAKKQDFFFEKCQRPTEKVQSLSISNVNRNVFKGYQNKLCNDRNIVDKSYLSRTKLGLAFENMSYIKSPIFPPYIYR